MSESDNELLSRYALQRSEDAFAEIVSRHVDLVHAAALRQVRLPQLAEEVAQSVFTDLARHSARLPPPINLAAWLYQVAHRTAVDVVRRESRRQKREQIALEMNANNAHQSEWLQIESLLDEAICALGETDRVAIILRFFQNKNLREIGLSLGTSEDTAQKRVTRAIETLRGFFASRGITIGAGAFVVLLSTHAVSAAPAGLAATIAASAGKTVLAAAGLTIPNAIAMTTLQKIFIGCAIAITLAGGLFEARRAARLGAELQLSERHEKEQTADIAQLKVALAAAKTQLTESGTGKRRLSNNNELLRLRSQVNALRAETNKLGAIPAAKANSSDDNTLKDLLAIASREEKRDATNAVSQRIAKLKNALALAPEQEIEIRKLFLSNIEPQSALTLAETTGTMSSDEIKKQSTNLLNTEQSDLQALLTPDQQVVYERIKKDNSMKASRRFGSREAERMKRELNLSPEQTDRAASILAELPAGQGGPGNALDADAKDQLETRLRALDPVLTPEQLQAYREATLREIELSAQAASIFKHLGK
jgi:RNA polymerase sigma factor (sigma-70 family)